MIIRIKDTFKLTGLAIIGFCAVFICTLFLNYMLDLSKLNGLIENEAQQAMFDAQIATSKVVCIAAGGCLLLTSALMLLFYIRHYVDVHKKELGILKALGYSDFFISSKFFVFGISVALGTGGGFLGACLFLPAFYRVQASNNNVPASLPEVSLSYHFSLFAFLVLIPTVFFSLLAVISAMLRLKRSPILLLKSGHEPLNKKYKTKNSLSDTSFLNDMRKSTLRSKKILVFFCVFSSLCFASTTQMSLSMEKYSSRMMSVLMILIGIILSSTTLILALFTVIEGNTKDISMMKVFGYTDKECKNAITGGYRVWSYTGFFVGTLYQYLLLKIMINTVFGESLGSLPPYEFNFAAMLISLAAFTLFYELLIHFMSKKIGRVRLVEIMSEK